MTNKNKAHSKPSQKRNVKIRSVSLNPEIDRLVSSLMTTESDRQLRRVGRSELINKILAHYFKK